MPRPGEGRVSRYAWGDADYHDLIRDRLNQLADFLYELQSGGPCARRCGYRAALRSASSRSSPGWVGSVRTRCS